MSGNTWIEFASPERLEVRHRAGRLQSFLYLTFGGFAAVYAIIEPSNVRWAAAVLGVLNIFVAWHKTSLVTISFDRASNTVQCGERRPFLNHQASLPLKEFLGTELRPSVAGGGKKFLGLATRDGVFIPIDPKFSPEDSREITKTIDDWIEGKVDVEPMRKAP